MDGGYDVGGNNMMPQFDVKVPIADGQALLIVRGPVQAEGGIGVHLQIVPVEDMLNWRRIWAADEVTVKP